MCLIVIKEKGLRYRLEAYFAFYELSKLRIDERIIETLEEGKVGPLITDRMGAYLSGSWGEGPFLRYMAYLVSSWKRWRLCGKYKYLSALGRRFYFDIR